jgi:uncharacterized protein with HEPN domain
MRHDQDRLLDVVEAARAIGRFIAGHDATSFAADDLVRSAVCAKLAILGEAVRNLSQSLIDAHPQIPWGQIVGTRNRITHGYDQVDFALVWQIATVDVLKLLNDVERILTSQTE